MQKTHHTDKFRASKRTIWNTSELLQNYISPIIFTSENLNLATNHKLKCCKNTALIFKRCFKPVTHWLSNAVQPCLERPVLADKTHPQEKHSVQCPDTQPQEPMHLKRPNKKLQFADKTIYKQTLS